MSLRSDDLDSVSELYTQDDFRQLAVAIEATPVFLGGLGELEDQGERGLVRETSLGAHRAVANRREWPAPGSEDTELGVLMELEVGHGETEVHAGVQA